MTGILNILAGAIGGAVKDAYFNLVSLLLPGNGTNGANNNFFLDSSSNNFTITRNPTSGPNAPTQGTFSPFSQTGWGNYFNGTSSYISAADSASFDLGATDWTIELWAYFNSVSGEKGLVSHFTAGTPNAGYTLRLSTSNSPSGLRLVCSGSSDVVLQAAWTPVVGTWYHIAAVRNSGTLYIYVDGQQIGSTSIAITIGNPSALFAVGTAQTVASSDFNGYISNIRVVKSQALYTGAFTPAKSALTVSTVGSTGAGVPTQTITGTVSLLSCQSNRFVDNGNGNSGSGFPITVNGSPSVVAFSPFAPTAAYTTAAVGGSGYFDGTGDYLTAPGNSAFDLGSGDFTIEAWIYTQGSGSRRFIDYANGTATNANFSFSMLVTSGNVAYGSVVIGSTVYAVTGTTTVTNTWTHVALVRNGTASGNLKLYVNGVAEGTAASLGSTAINTLTGTPYLSISSYYNGAGEFFNGYVSSARIIKGTALYTANFTPSTAPFTAVSGTSLLLNFTNAGITDATAKNDLETVGNAQISTTVNTPFNGTNGSMYFDGAGTPADRLTGPNTQNTAFGTGNFVIEFFVYPTSSSATFRSLFDSRSGAVNTGISIWQNGTSIEIYGASQQFVASSVFTINSWQHVAVSRSSNTVRVYVGGTQRGSNYTNSNDMTDTRLVIGNDNSLAYPFVGYISNFRITKGNDRNYTGSTIPVPSAPFPVQ